MSRTIRVRKTDLSPTMVRWSGPVRFLGTTSRNVPQGSAHSKALFGRWRLGVGRTDLDPIVALLCFPGNVINVTSGCPHPCFAAFMAARVTRDGKVMHW
uniref:Uncharacterized protein n=1 Tax=Amphimedon queenslandica TaxID=400682 RepID=A0A1X7TSF8_AMPQE